jgi:GlpG protein
MRLIGTITRDQHAALFSDYLFVRGIENRVELEGQHYEVWVLDDAQMDEAKHLLQQFTANPAAPEYSTAPQAARKKEAQLLEEEEAAAKRSFNSRQILNRQHSGLPYVTFFLFIVSIVVAALTKLGGDTEIIQPWVITKFEIYQNFIRWQGGLQEIRQGEVWRLITPVFIHFGPVHLIFNMLNLLMLGGMIERVKGSGYVLIFVFVTAILSNLAEYSINLPPLSRAVPSFGGMSGVVYGLFGYAWMKSKFDFGSGIMLHPNTVAMMVVWYLICFSGILPIANMAHTVGLLIGMLWGYLSARRSVRR